MRHGGWHFFLWVAIFAAGAWFWQSFRAPASKPAAPTAVPAAPVLKPVPAPVPVPEAGPLANAPGITRAVYFTNWSAGLKRRVDYLVELRKTTGMNAVVIDVKDYSGYLAYRASVPQAQEYGAIRPAIRDVDSLIARLHAEGIAAIARITCFQDPILANARPELAVHSQSKFPPGGEPTLSPSTLWLDRKGLAWIDPAARPAWEYLAAIAREALDRGFDEINFDYVRFPSDGDLKDMYFPSWDGQTPKHAAIAGFFAYLRRELGDARLSVDLFGLATVNEDDLGIGQVIEDAYQYFDFVCPMVYPSHFAHGFLNFPNPAEHPYEVVNYSIVHARERLETLASVSKPLHVQVRPWLQDFNLGARYDPPMVESEIRAVSDALGDAFAGYMLWSSSNVYTREALGSPSIP